MCAVGEFTLQGCKSKRFENLWLKLAKGLTPSPKKKPRLKQNLRAQWLK